MKTLPILLTLVPAALCAQVWTVRVEEPTGLYRRTGEVVAIPVAKLGGHTAGFSVTDPGGRELPWQVGSGELLFPVSLVPGELPEYAVTCCAAKPGKFANPILLRKVGLRRVEFGNAFYRAVIDTGTGAFVEVYSLRAGAHKSLNLVDTTPESREALKGDIHGDTQQAASVIPPPVAGVDGGNIGWTSLGGQGAFTNVELLESGPARGRLRLTRAGEGWEITWTAGSAAFAWKAQRGFRACRRRRTCRSTAAWADRSTPAPRVLGSRNRGSAPSVRASGRSCRADTWSTISAKRITGRWAWWRWTRN
jgi:hypothetical protein